MKKICIALLALCAPVLPAAAQDRPVIEDCGWLIEGDGMLSPQHDAALHPSEAKPLPPAPQGAKAAYCIRDRFTSNENDRRLLALGLPLVIRSGEREGVLEDAPRVTFEYHLDANSENYFPGKEPDEPAY